MAQELRRLSGYRRIGGLYLTGTLYKWPGKPVQIMPCPTCGVKIGLSRNLTRITEAYFHMLTGALEAPSGSNYLAFVSKHFYPKVEDFEKEALERGVSKRVPFVPKDLIIGRTCIYLAHEDASGLSFSIFGWFIPNQIEKLVWESKATPALYKQLLSAGVHVVTIKDGDIDHAAYKGRVLKTLDYD
jgi:hypothetical protein